jgi:hypothetical protein
MKDENEKKVTPPETTSQPKRLSLRRETVRQLAVSSGIRTGVCKTGTLSCLWIFTCGETVPHTVSELPQ